MSLATYIRTAKGILFKNRPIYVHFAITDRCNLRCSTCSIWKRETPYQELSVKEISDLASLLYRLGTVQVSLGGGEPAMRSDLPQVVSAFIRAGLRTRVLTNGVALTRKTAKSLLDAGLREISFSLDSLKKDEQEYIDNTGDTFSRRIENLLDVADLLPRKNVLPLLNTIVTPKNLNELPDILDLAERIGFFASFIPVHGATEQTGEHRFYGDDQALRFRSEDRPRLDDAYRFLIEAKKSGRPVLNSTAFLKSCPEYLVSGKVSWPCLAGSLYLSISPDGMISPCHAFEGKSGVHFSEFENSFRSETYHQNQRKLIAQCEGCYRPCWAEISYLASDLSSIGEMMSLQLRARKQRPKIDPGLRNTLLNKDGNQS